MEGGNQTFNSRNYIRKIFLIRFLFRSRCVAFFSILSNDIYIYICIKEEQFFVLPPVFPIRVFDI